MIAEKLEPLIARRRGLRALQRGDMGERALEQIRIRKAVADGLLKHGGRGDGPAHGFRRLFGRHGFRSLAAAGAFGALAAFEGGADGAAAPACALDFGLAAHRTIENSRLQRTVHGQRQICHARSPSAIEKKIICARPTRFWNGT